ncbi:hypothetical protein VF21_07016 [Pseudogymnoascus sp. 05NY08]|nr:hypothetical protein VF21_07016 [Pseudogymnoascus sp. 05NY08]
MPIRILTPPDRPLDVVRRMVWRKRKADSVYRADDLIPEESDVVLQAIKRLPPKESYDRVFRLRRAFQDYPYLSPIIQEIEAELKERNDLDSLVVKRR